MRIGDLVTRDVAKLAHPCWRKQAFGSHGAALAQLRSLGRRGFLDPQEGANVYQCPFCTRWHTGRTAKHPQTKGLTQ